MGGFEIHEFRHAYGETNLACADHGSDERVRTVGISDDGPFGALWPIQVAPFPAFGGICPGFAEPAATPTDNSVYPVPGGDAEPISATGLSERKLDSWSIYSLIVPNWQLTGLETETDAGCGWITR